MAHKNGPWTIKETKEKYHNSFINVREDQVLQPDGQPGMYATVKMKPSVAILPIDSDRNLYLIWQFRYALVKKASKLYAVQLRKMNQSKKQHNVKLKKRLASKHQN